ncbi:ABC transporter permease [Desulfitibacter alkalitolerans]|uniref:ABC transporter permease n=1 Tax=Desulfitibacter alkalitolerans TaxID=264641 RepID=UPI000480F5D1|nr:ABC transporter permease subunit [Desulfitibacter alkalitolerans]
MKKEGLLSPVLTKELKQRFRTFRGPLVVVLYLGAVVAITLAFVYLSTRHGVGTFQPDRSRELFIMLSMLQLFMIAFVTPGMSAGVISSERERQTLNILLTTRLSPASIILSKLISSLSFTLLLVITTLPVYAVVTLYGGIAPKQLAGVFGLYLLNMVFFGSVGVFLSTWIRKTAISTVISYALIFALVVFTFLGAELIDQYARNNYHMEIQRMTTETTTAAAEKPGSYPDTQVHPYIMYETPGSVWILRSLNPVIVMVSIFEMGFGGEFPYNPWKIYTISYAVLSVVLIIVSIYMLPPVKRGIINRTRM